MGDIIDATGVNILLELGLQGHVLDGIDTKYMTLLTFIKNYTKHEISRALK